MSATAPFTINVDAIPAYLRSLPQWVLWRYETRGGKPTKVPIRAIDGRPAKSTDPADWVSFDDAMESGVESSGVGFVFAAGGGLVGIDIDGCIGADGRMEHWGRAILDRFPTYAEVSPSGTGVKLWARGQMPRKGGKRRAWRSGAVEMYEEARFFTVTSNRLDGAAEGIADCQASIAGLYAMVFGEKAAPPPPAPAAPASADDQAIIDKLLSERGDKAARLWSGDASGYLSASEADLALCCKIAFYTGHDAPRIESLFSQSALVRGKWADRELYRKATISAALQQVTTFYDWKIRPAGLPRHPGAASTLAETTTPPEEANADGLARLIEETISGKRRAVPWPWPTLSRVTKALLPGTITVLCGSAGSKKSMILNQCCLHWFAAGVPFAVFHLEEDRDYHMHRALAQLARNSAILDDDKIRGRGDDVYAAMNEHREALDRFAKHITDAPRSMPTLVDLADWLRERAKAGARVLAIDPVTAADSGREPWIEDRRFILEAKTIMRDFGASLVLVTHPRAAQAKGVDRLDNLAGGKAYNRFTQTVLWLQSSTPGDQVTVRGNVVGVRQEVEPDLRIHICKSRNGRGHGWDIAYGFSNDTLLTEELGLIVEDDE